MCRVDLGTTPCSTQDYSQSGLLPAVFRDQTWASYMPSVCSSSFSCGQSTRLHVAVSPRLGIHERLRIACFFIVVFELSPIVLRT